MELKIGSPIYVGSIQGGKLQIEEMLIIGKPTNNFIASDNTGEIFTLEEVDGRLILAIDEYGENTVSMVDFGGMVVENTRYMNGKTSIEQHVVEEEEEDEFLTKFLEGKDLPKC